VNEVVQFDYDPVKSQINQSKHGIDFEKAKILWNDSYRVEIQAVSTTILGTNWDRDRAVRAKFLEIRV